MKLRPSWPTIFSPRSAAIVLIVSGLFHLSFFVDAQVAWDGPLSPRKPGLFGVSAGLTAFSLLWSARVLHADQCNLRIVSAVLWALFVEVALITIQYWRGVPSHFNRKTPLDAGIETLMLVLILSVTAGIASIFRVSMKPAEIDRTKLLGLRAGLAFLLLSCFLGIVTMICGEYNLMRGKEVETWGRAGVLKYPHGAVLHAIQTIPVLNWLMVKLVVSFRQIIIRLVIVAHLSFLFHATWQTVHGYPRCDVDLVGGIALFTSMTLILLSIALIVMQATRRKGLKTSLRTSKEIEY